MPETSLELFKTTYDQQTMLGAKLIQIARLIGCNEAPDPDKEIPAILHFLIRQFGYMTTEDISRAFELYCAGKLNTKAVHYGSLNLQFIGQVLNAYRDQKAETVTQRQLPETAHMREEERLWLSYHGLLDYLSKHEKMPEVFPWSDVYRFLRDQGRMNLTTDQIQTYNGIAMSEFRKHATTAAEMIRFIDHNGSLKARRRKLAVLDWVYNMIEKNTLKKFINDEKETYRDRP